jgi:hypothetical protein
MPKQALEKSTATIPLPAAIRPASTTRTVSKTSSTGISANASSQNVPKHNGNRHLPRVVEKNPVSNSAFSANSARRCSSKNDGFNQSEQRAPNDSQLKVAVSWRQFVSAKSALSQLAKTVMRVLRRGPHMRPVHRDPRHSTLQLHEACNGMAKSPI